MKLLKRSFLPVLALIILIGTHSVNILEGLGVRYDHIADKMIIDVQGSYLVFNETDPRYPHSSDNPVVQITTSFLHSYHSDWVSSSEYLSDEWTNGGPAGATASDFPKSKTVVEFEGISFVLRAGYPYSIIIPPKKSGNASIRAKFKVDVYRTIYILKDGTQVSGSTFKRYTQIDKEVYPVFR